MKKTFATLFFLAFVLAACSPASMTVESPQLVATETVPLATATASPEASQTSTPLPTETETPRPSSTPIPSETPSPEPTPTYAILSGTVNVEKVSCRYGPGAMYLYLYGMVQGARQDIIGRNDNGSWALTKSRGDDKSCWVKSDLMDINGEMMGVQPIHPDDYRLPQSPYYGPLTNVTAKRNGNEVIISWSPLILRAGDDSLQTPYVLQVWVCRAGQVVMESLGSYQTSITVVDESGCSEASRGRITAAEKHGYTRFVEIPWP